MNNTRKSTVRHTLNMAIGLREAKETLGILNNQFSLLEDLSRKMTHEFFNVQHMPQLLQKAGVIPAESVPSARAKNIIEEVTQRFYTGQGANLKSSKGTAWGAYNAVVEYVDHFRGSDALKRAQSSILGGGANIKERAFDLLAKI